MKYRAMTENRISNFRNSRFEGNKVTLEPFTQKHIPELLDAARDPKIWEFHPENRCDTHAHARFLDQVIQQIEKNKQLAWAVKCNTSGKHIGFVRFFSPDTLFKTWEMGTWLTSEYWGTGANNEIKEMLLTAAFIHFDFDKIIYKTDVTNIRSQKAIQQLGAKCTAYIPAERITWKGLLRSAYYYELTPTLWLSRKMEKALHDLKPEQNHIPTLVQDNSNSGFMAI